MVVVKKPQNHKTTHYSDQGKTALMTAFQHVTMGQAKKY